MHDSHINEKIVLVLASFVIVVAIGLALPVLLSLKNQNKDDPCYFNSNPRFNCSFNNSSLQYNFYQKACPEALQLITTEVEALYQKKKGVAPALIRLAFHDCFIGGCDASVLLNGSIGMKSEKEVFPNLNLRGFETIDSIKQKLEEVCPSTVSCADIVVLAARDALSLGGAPYYPLATGRRDSISAYAETALMDIPNPDGDVQSFLPKFADRGFDAKETVALLGAHAVGVIHCSFVQQRLYNFTQSASGGADPSINRRFLAELSSKCPNLNSLPEEARLRMVSSGSEKFGNHYYDMLSHGRGVLHSDQQLMSLAETATWVEAFRSNVSLFHLEFANAMIKLSNFNVTMSPNGDIRVHCSRVK